MPVKLVEVKRSKVVESVHKGDIAVVNSEDVILLKAGDLNRTVFLRSSLKPLQALAAMEAGIVEKFGLNMREIAIMASSHSGEPEHIEVLKSLLEKTGLREEMLECGIHEPLNKEVSKELISCGQGFTRLHCNCSGKHIGLMAAALAKGIPVKGYSENGHAIQESIIKILSDFSGVEPKNIAKGVDGCGMVVYAIPLKNAAMAYANLCNENFLKGKYKKSQNYILSAMTMYPEMVAGKDRFDTVLMKSFGDRVVGKIGAEGVYCAGIIGKSTGIALKVDDGNSRAVGPIILELLVQMKMVKKEEAEGVKDFWKPDVTNHKGEKVGEIKAVFKIK